jgi:hypothetical protein
MARKVKQDGVHIQPPASGEKDDAGNVVRPKKPFRAPKLIENKPVRVRCFLN